MSYLEKIFSSFIKQHGIEMEAEHKFHPTRRWRFDFADLSNKIAVEVEGGIWIDGRHNRGSGFRNDAIKYNAATVLGWKVLRYCSSSDIAEYFLKDYYSLLKKS